MLPVVAMLMFYAVACPVGALIAFPVTWITGNARFLWSFGAWIGRTGVSMGGIRTEVSGRELAPEGRACIYMSNHISNLDPPIMITRIPGQVSVMIKSSLMQLPLLGMAFRMASFVPVERNKQRSSAIESIRNAAEVLEKGISIAVFPEGTRSPDGRMLPFKKGPFYLAMETGACIVPVSIHGTETMMRKGSIRVTPGTAHIQFHAPIDPKHFATREELALAVREKIASGLPEWMRTPETGTGMERGTEEEAEAGSGPAATGE